MKLFVGGLAWATTAETLKQAFSSFGEVADSIVLSDRETGRSRGFGFVTFEREDDARKAIASMDGASLDGRTIRCNEAVQREDRPRREGGGGGGGFGGGGFGGGGGGRREGGFGGGGGGGRREGGFGGGGGGRGFGGGGGGGRGFSGGR